MLVAEFFSGLGVMLLDITGGAIKAAVVPDRLRARVSGAYMVVNYGVRPLGALAGGLLGAAIGVRADPLDRHRRRDPRRALAAAVADHAHARAAGDGRVNLAVVDGFEIVRVEGEPDERFQAGSVSKSVAALTALASSPSAPSASTPTSTNGSPPGSSRTARA